MKKEQFLFIIVGIILITALILRLTEDKRQASNQDTSSGLARDNNLIGQENDNDIDKKIVQIELEDSSIKIIQPQAGEVIASPYQVKGLMSANCLKEFNFYVVLLDENQVAIAIAKLQSDQAWFNLETVPVWADLEFDNTFSSQGYISIRKEENGQLLAYNQIEIIKIELR